jgi:outer membrane receptor protein involved in Fe transport
VGDVILGKGWSFGARFTYGSGYAYTPSVAVYDNTRKQWEWQVSETNSAHLPAYSRLDVRASKQFEWFGVPVDFYLDINNLLNTKNTMGYSYRINRIGDPYIEEVKLWPILPTFGMSVKF